MPSQFSAPSSAPAGLVRQRPLGELTSMQIGGNAEYFTAPPDAAALRSAARWARDAHLNISILGGGSNVVVHDRGVRGLVIQPAMTDWKFDLRGDEIIATVGAALPWDWWVAQCVDRGWAGLECLSGIPGAVGATPVQNVGAYGQEVASRIVAVDTYDLHRDCTERMAADQCEFGYRTSRFKTDNSSQRVVTSVTFRLSVGRASPIRYGELSQCLEGTASPSLKQIRKAVLTIRGRKSMLLDPADPNSRSCGSFFLNPVISHATLDSVSTVAGERPPYFTNSRPSDANAPIKVPAAWLIERAGFKKGQRFGGVGISSAHTLALVCHRGATASAVVDAARTIRNGVADTFGIDLHPEPRFLGFASAGPGLPAN